MTVAVFMLDDISHCRRPHYVVYALAGSILTCLATTAAAWTSAQSPVTTAVHQKAIETVLGKQLDPPALAVLENEQGLVDKDQEPAQSAEHAMTGIIDASHIEATERPHYIAASEMLLRKDLTAAIDARKSGNSAAALPALGKALHILEDATSPAHRGFQSWSYNEGIVGSAVHVFKERSYPTDDSADKYRSHLEGVVQYAYDIYMERKPIPPHFFDPISGQLLLDVPYLAAK
jgi:hypothetical protein